MTLGNDQRRCVQWQQIAVATDAIATRIMIEVLRVNEEVVIHILLEEKHRATGLTIIDTARQAADLLWRRGHGAVPDDGLLPHFAGGASLAILWLDDLEARVE
ncbi:MAG: hypothetical protein IPK32_25475 [Verrucomicrobiaceae bacterium]|nr:hypothetical protein [Verrucomicrobiaceae bacterium]